MNIVVTGGAGFIGSHLIDRLLHERHSVLNVDSLLERPYSAHQKHGNIARHESHPRYQHIQHPLRFNDPFGTIFDGILNLAPLCPEPGRWDVVVHLAARSNARQSADLRAHLPYMDNIMGTIELLQAMTTADSGPPPRLVVNSSSSVYGDHEPGQFALDSPTDRPMSFYAWTKQAVERLCYYFHYAHGIQTTILRPFSVYGPRGRPDLCIRVFAEHILRGETITIMGDGSSARSFTYIDDMVDALMAAIEHPVDFETLNVGATEAVSIADIITLLSGITGKTAMIDYKDANPADVPYTAADISRTTEILGWTPKIGIEDGLTRFVDWLKTEIVT